VAARYVLSAYNRRALRRNVEQSRRLRYPESASDSENEQPRTKIRRTKPRKHQQPATVGNATLNGLDITSEDRCYEISVDGFPYIAFSSAKEYEQYRSGRLTPKRPLEALTGLDPENKIGSKSKKSSKILPQKYRKRRKSKSSKASSLSDSDGPLLEPGDFFSLRSATPYNPDTESGDSLYSDSTEYFRPHSATLREKLPAEVSKSKKKRKAPKRNCRSVKVGSVKKEPRDSLIDPRVQQVLTYQHHHQHSHHHTMALPLVMNPLGVNWSPFAIQLNDPMLMASLAGAQQLALHKPLKAAPMSRWNSMHARIAHFIFQDKKKKKSNENKNKEQGRDQPETSKPKDRNQKKKLTNRPESVPSAFASIVSGSLSETSRSLWDRQFIPNPNFSHFQRFNL